MTIREATASDAASIQDVAVRSGRAAYDGVVDDRAIIDDLERPGFVDSLREWLATVEATDGYLFLVCERPPAPAADGGTDYAAPPGATAVEVRTPPAAAAGTSGSTTRHGRRIVGFVQFIWNPSATAAFIGPDECLLQSLYVDPARWREGVGTELVRAGVDRLPHSVRTLRLGVLKRNDRGISFYEGTGFDRTGDVSYEVAGVDYDCYVYSLPL